MYISWILFKKMKSKQLIVLLTKYYNEYHAFFVLSINNSISNNPRSNFRELLCMVEPSKFNIVQLSMEIFHLSGLFIMTN